jgi:hypothetical protein
MFKTPAFRVDDNFQKELTWTLSFSPVLDNMSQIRKNLLKVAYEVRH